MEMTYLHIIRKLYTRTSLSMQDAGLSATAALEKEGYALDYRAADEVAFRLTTATAVLGQDWDEADGATRRMLLHLAELPIGTLEFLQERLRAVAGAAPPNGAPPEGQSGPNGHG